MKKEKEQVRTICGWCGKKSDKCGFFAGGSGNISFGYGSKFDGAVYKFDICDDCFEQYTDKLAVRKMQKIDAEVASGKRKLLSAREAMGKIIRENKRAMDILTKD